MRWYHRGLAPVRHAGEHFTAVDPSQPDMLASLRLASCPAQAALASYDMHPARETCARGGVQGTLRVLLVLLHDFPEFLCQYHFPLCDCIPPPCIQARPSQAVGAVFSCTDCWAVCPNQLPLCLCASQT